MQVLKYGLAALGHTCSYEVHYRNHVTHKWALLAVASANTDALNEVVLDLRPYFNQRDGLFTQTLRIRPLGHHLRPVLRAAVYGLDMKASVVSQSTVQRYRSICEQHEVDHSCSGIDTDGEQDAVTDRDVTATIQYVLAGAHSGSAVKVAKDGRSTYQQAHCTGQGGWTQQGEADYLEINLAYPRYVTHIGIAGKKA